MGDAGGYPLPQLPLLLALDREDDSWTNMPLIDGSCSWSGRNFNGLQTADGSGNKDGGMQLKTCQKTYRKEKREMVWGRCCNVRLHERSSSVMFLIWKYGQMIKKKRNFMSFSSGIVLLCHISWVTLVFQFI